MKKKTKKKPTKPAKTIVLPKVLQRIEDVIKPVHIDIIIIVFLVALKVLFLGYNSLSFPYIENDEATYAIRGASFIETGELDMYTYWYDHAPGGWMFIGLWYLITGKTALLGSYIASARIFMLVLNVVNLVLLYVLAKRLTRQRMYALFACLFFILSPLALYYQRRILLDNVMTFWVLISLLLAVREHPSLKHSAGSAVAFALAVLTKINAIFFGPAILLSVILKTGARIRKQAIILWLGFAGSIVSLFPTYALLKGELFSKNPDPSSGAFENGISLIDTTLFQASRGGESLPPWNSLSEFYVNAQNWYDRDPLLIVLGAVGFVVASLMLLRRSERAYMLPIVVAVGFMSLFLMRGGIVLDFYFLPLLPLMSILAVVIIFAPMMLGWVQSMSVKAVYFTATAMLIGLNYLGIPEGIDALALDETSNQLAAIHWVEKNVPKDSYIVTDNYATVFLNTERDYVNTDYNFKVEYDPEVREKIGNDWRNIDYMVITHEMLKQMNLGTTPIIREAFDHSELVADFTDNSSSFLDFNRYISTNGDWARVYRVKNELEIVRQDSWKFFRDNNVVSYGQVIDPENNDRSTSSLQASAMQRAVDEKDKAAFAGIWAWTRDHFQNRLQDKLLSSSWEKNDAGEYELGDSNTTSRGDIDAAAALIQAHALWPKQGYLKDAKAIINDIWNQEVVSLNGQYYLMAFATDQTQQILVNPSYIAPYYFRQFAELDPGHDWAKLIDDSYALLARIQNKNTGLIPNWIAVNATGEIADAAPLVGAVANNYGYESFRLSLRIAQDNAYHKEARAHRLLEPMAGFFAGEMSRSDRVAAIYTLDGQAVEAFEDTATYTAVYAALDASGIHDELSERILKEKILGQFDQETFVWGGAPKNIINQSWNPVFMSFVNSLTPQGVQ